MTINFYTKNVYGNDLFYIADPKQAENIRKLTKRKTIDQSDMKALETLGVKFNQILPPV